MKVLFIFFAILLTANSYPFCSQCIDPAAKKALEKVHDLYKLRVLYNNSWPSCSTLDGRRNAVRDRYGCFQLKIETEYYEEGLIGRGNYVLMQAPMASLLNIEHEDMRNKRPNTPKLYIQDGLVFKFTFCYDSWECFTEENHYAPEETCRLIPAKTQPTPPAPVQITTNAIIPCPETNIICEYQESLPQNAFIISYSHCFTIVFIILTSFVISLGAMYLWMKNIQQNELELVRNEDIVLS